jgi:hypothetical protein
VEFAVRKSYDEIQDSQMVEHTLYLKIKKQYGGVKLVSHFATSLFVQSVAWAFQVTE